MAQNRSSAVMQQRAEPHDSLDFFPTPPWGTRALCEHVLDQGRTNVLKHLTVWEPACGEGHMARPLGEYFSKVIASDVHDYGFGFQEDFLMPFAIEPLHNPDWIITNPPFRLAQQFVETALLRATVGVAVLVRSAWLEGGDRHRELFSQRPPAIIAQFCERVVMLKGRLVRSSAIDPMTDKRASSATSYCWVVWGQGRCEATQFMWIPPCRLKLEREGDYD